MASAAATDEVSDFKRRARRRLIGAIALVLLLVIVPPWIMEREPRPVVSNLSVEIPSQEAKKLAPKPPPERAAKADEKAVREDATEKSRPRGVEAPKTEPVPAAAENKPTLAESEKPKPDAPPETALKPAPKEPPVKKSRDAERAQAILSGAGFVVPLGTYSSADNVKQLQSKLSAAGVKSYTEPVAGSGEKPGTRVRAGPFPTREAAEKARAKLAGMGLKPGAVANR